MRATACALTMCFLRAPPRSSHRRARALRRRDPGPFAEGFDFGLQVFALEAQLGHWIEACAWSPCGTKLAYVSAYLRRWADRKTHCFA